MEAGIWVMLVWECNCGMWEYAIQTIVSQNIYIVSHFLKLEVRRRRILHPFSIPPSVADPDPGSSAVVTPASGMFHISESSVTIFWVKILKFLVADPDPGSDAFLPWIRDQGWKNSDPRSGINIPDPQHCLHLVLQFMYVHLLQSCFHSIFLFLKKF